MVPRHSVVGFSAAAGTSWWKLQAGQMQDDTFSTKPILGGNSDWNFVIFVHWRLGLHKLPV
jgi:hypothetical protein